jgi:glyceraldehyde-3-phosphate dehydrogenase (NADP+)
MFIHEEIWDAFMAKFVEGAKNLKLGDPLDSETDLGPMVDQNAASRTQRWVDEALADGGKALLGGKANGTFFPPTILTEVPITAAVCSNEAFAPLVVAFPFTDIGDAIRGVNDSSFGLQTGIFTNDLGAAWRSFNELEVGGVIVNDVPTYRIDHMPYGGVKDSGLGREGLRWAIEQGYDVINMSLSTTKQKFASLLHELADTAYFRRTMLVASAHNMPVESYPWRFSSVISVGSHEQEDPYEYYYNPAPPVEFFARGVD